jgi:hypothetical protein
MPAHDHEAARYQHEPEGAGFPHTCVAPVKRAPLDDRHRRTAVLPGNIRISRSRDGSGKTERGCDDDRLDEVVGAVRIFMFGLL